MSLLLWGRGCVATTGADVGEDKPLLPLLLLLLLGTSHENVALGPQPGSAAEIPAMGMNLEEHMAEVEKNYIRQALTATGGTMTEAAKLLGMTFRAIRYKVRKHGLR